MSRTQLRNEAILQALRDAGFISTGAGEFRKYGRIVNFSGVMAESDGLTTGKYYCDGYREIGVGDLFRAPA